MTRKLRASVGSSERQATRPSVNFTCQSSVFTQLRWRMKAGIEVGTDECRFRASGSSWLATVMPTIVRIAYL